MGAKKLSVTLKGSTGDRGDIILNDLQEFCAALAACLRKCEKRVGVESRLDYRVVALRRGSCVLAIQPADSSPDAEKKTDTETQSEVIDLFGHTVRALENGKPLDPRLSSHDLKDFKRLTRTYGSKIRSIQFGQFQLTNRYTTNVTRLMTQPTVAEGEITGVLERIDVHERSAFTLFPNIGGPVLCEFRDELLGDVKAAIKRNVTVHGRLMYYLGSEFPGKAHVTKIEILPDDDELPTLDDLRGLLANGTRHG